MRNGLPISGSLPVDWRDCICIFSFKPVCLAGQETLAHSSLRPTAVRVQAVASVENLDDLQGGSLVSRDALAGAPRWSIIVRPSAQAVDGMIELGELCRVHRGQVTGANNIWIAGRQARTLPLRVQLPTVTKARDLIDAGMHLRSQENLRRLVDLPPDLGELDDDERVAVDAFLLWAKSQGADKGYVARHRKAWWAVGLKVPAPILCTYMARRPPQVTLNSCHARHINIAHGLYPRDAISAEHLDGTAQVVPIAVLAGVFNLLNLEQAQDRGLALFWSHDLDRLGEFVGSTKATRRV